MNLEISLLGRFEVVVDGRPVPASAWGRRHAAWLVKRLALTPSRRLHREQVIDDLWPDLDVDTATPRLHKAVHYARRGLGAAVGLEVLGDSLALAPGHDVDVDAVRFRELARAALRGGSATAADEALALYAGELLPDDRYEPWTQRDRDDLAMLRRDLLRHAGRWDALLAEDPLDEAAHVALARAYADRGDRNAALRQLERLSDLLADELGVSPGSEATALRASLDRPVDIDVRAAPGGGLRVPLTQYADSRGHSIAYQVVGDGPGDIVFVPGFVSNVDLQWELPGMAAFFGRLSQLGRLIVFDKCATGLSERPPLDALPTLEERMDDVRAVMDAAGSNRATIFGISEGGPMAALFAATYPERVERLVIYGSFARGPFGERLEPLVSMIRRRWGSGNPFGRLAPSWASDDVMRRFLARYEAHSATPTAAAGLLRLADSIDVRPTLASVSAPALVLHRRDDDVVGLGFGVELASGIPNAEFVELAGEDHLVYVDGDDVLAHVEAFLAGAPAGAPTSRMLATILFVDVVNATSHARALGDERWHRALRTFVDGGRQAVVQHRGTVRAVTGDGFMAVFDGPARAVRCSELLHRLAADAGLEVRCGVHTAEVDVVGDELAGIGVHIAARVSAAASPGATYVTRTVRDLVAGSGLALSERGAHQLKGIDEPWELYAAAT